MQYELNGYVIPGTTQERGMWLTSATEYAPALAPRRADLYIPQVHYAVPLWGDPMSAITLTLQVRIKGDDVDDLRGLWNDFIGLLWPGSTLPMTVKRHRGTYIDTAEAQLVSTSTPDFSCVTNRLDATAILNIPGGSWRGQYVEQTISVDGVQMTVGQESSLPIADSLIRVQGSNTLITVEVTDANSGTGIHWGNGVNNVPAGKWLLIDPYNMRAVRKSSNDWDITSYEADFSGILTFLGVGPFTITPLRSGPTPTVSAGVAGFASIANNPVVRARSAAA